jgi:DNA-binding CsgD family transcriptional regulator
MEAIDNAITMMGRLRLPDLAVAHVLRAATRGLAGQLDAMEADLAAAAEQPMDESVRAVGVPGHVRSFVALAHGRHDEARGHLATAMEYHRRVPTLPFSLRGFWALLETALGAPDDGAAAREEVRTGPQANSPHNWFALRYADAIALGRAGDRTEAERVFADAEWGLPGREPWPELQARLLVAIAAARDGWGEPERWFRHALDGLVGYGLTEAASSCRVAMRDAGFAVPRKAAGSQRVPAHLQRIGVTAREYDVLELVVEGLQNKQIAERLYLSVRTVETHVTRLLQRTGAADRGALASYLTQ